MTRWMPPPDAVESRGQRADDRRRRSTRRRPRKCRPPLLPPRRSVGRSRSTTTRPAGGPRLSSRRFESVRGPAERWTRRWDILQAVSMVVGRLVAGDEGVRRTAHRGHLGRCAHRVREPVTRPGGSVDHRGGRWAGAPRRSRAGTTGGRAAPPAAVRRRRRSRWCVRGVIRGLAARRPLAAHGCSSSFRRNHRGARHRRPSARRAADAAPALGPAPRTPRRPAARPRRRRGQEGAAGPDFDPLTRGPEITGDPIRPQGTSYGRAQWRPRRRSRPTRSTPAPLTRRAPHPGGQTPELTRAPTSPASSARSRCAPVRAVPALEANLSQGSGSLDLVWLGQRPIEEDYCPRAPTSRMGASSASMNSPHDGVRPPLRAAGRVPVSEPPAQVRQKQRRRPPFLETVEQGLAPTGRLGACGTRIPLPSDTHFLRIGAVRQLARCHGTFHHARTSLSS